MRPHLASFSRDGMGHWFSWELCAQHDNADALYTWLPAWVASPYVRRCSSPAVRACLSALKTTVQAPACRMSVPRRIVPVPYPKSRLPLFPALRRSSIGAR